MVSSMACGSRLSSVAIRSLHSESVAIRSCSSSSVALSNVSPTSESFRPLYRALERARNDAPDQEWLAADDNPFVKSLSNVYSVVSCRFCQGSGEVKCDVCEGRGSLARGGFHKLNPVAMARFAGSNWTAIERTFGRHHFYVQSKRRGPGKAYFLEMVSACDETTRFWINAKILKDRERCSAGWLQRGELQDIEGPREELEEAKAATICKACKGCGNRPCHLCAKLEEGALHQSRELDIIDV